MAGKSKGSYRLTEQQAKFARAYVRLGVAEQAALEAGYAPDTARKQASRILEMPQVKAEVERLQALATERAVVSAAEVLQELALVGFADLSEFVEWGPDGVRIKDSEAIDPVRRRAIVEVSESKFGVKIKLADKIAALDRLGKHLGLFVDKVEHSGKVETIAPVVNLTLTTGAKKGKGDG